MCVTQSRKEDITVVPTPVALLSRVLNLTLVFVPEA